MTDNVVILDVGTSLDIPVSRVLEGAAGLEQCLVVGRDGSGNFYFASSQAGGPENLWLLELARIKLVAIAEEMAEDGQA